MYKKLLRKIKKTNFRDAVVVRRLLLKLHIVLYFVSLACFIAYPTFLSYWLAAIALAPTTFLIQRLIQYTCDKNWDLDGSVLSFVSIAVICWIGIVPFLAVLNICEFLISVLGRVARFLENWFD